MTIDNRQSTIDNPNASGVVGLIGGTGLGDALAKRIQNPQRHQIQTPFGDPSGDILTGRLGAHDIAFISRHGHGHRFNPSKVPYAANIFALKQLGATALIASGAVGSLADHIAPGHLVLVDQFIDKTHRRQNTFFDDTCVAHVELAEPCCSRLRNRIADAAQHIDATTHQEGTYVCMEGPQFSTRAESLMHRAWGGDLIGMTAMPEAKLAREAQMCYALIALPSDYDCWRPHEPGKDKQGLLAEIIGNLNKATDAAVSLVEKVLASDGALCDDNCACRKSLELAVWTAPEAINAEKKETLKCLFE
ncbi:MAG: S-methyl-5'-thioadenosine phosphorylase [Planctomycetota bacterium]